MALFKKQARTQPDRILEEGWQFYHRPTTLEPVGTVFRIDRARRRYIVDTLELQSQRGLEAESRLEVRSEIGASLLARLLGIGPEADANTTFAKTVTLVLNGPELEITTDREVDGVLGPFLDSLRYRADNRYFLIRNCRWAAAITYRLSRERIMALGGEATVNEALKLDGEVKVVNDRLYEISHDFPEVMRVMFLPEEIKPISAGLGSDEPQLGRVPVREQLVWEEAE